MRAKESSRLELICMYEGIVSVAWDLLLGFGC
jgi:hypothetical protein